jgi:hypothetical protein
VSRVHEAYGPGVLGAGAWSIMDQWHSGGSASPELTRRGALGHKSSLPCFAEDEEG